MVFFNFLTAKCLYISHSSLKPNQFVINGTNIVSQCSLINSSFKFIVIFVYNGSCFRFKGAVIKQWRSARFIRAYSTPDPYEDGTVLRYSIIYSLWPLFKTIHYPTVELLWVMKKNESGSNLPSDSSQDILYFISADLYGFSNDSNGTSH